MYIYCSLTCNLVTVTKIARKLIETRVLFKNLTVEYFIARIYEELTEVESKS